MRPPRMRFTVRRMMVAVAIVAMLLGITGAGLRSLVYGRRAEYHARMRATLLNAADHNEKEADRDPAEVSHWKKDPRYPKFGDAGVRSRLWGQAVYERRMAKWHEAMKDRYERAAANPLLPVESDPPPR